MVHDISVKLPGILIGHIERMLYGSISNTQSVRDDPSYTVREYSDHLGRDVAKRYLLGIVRAYRNCPAVEMSDGKPPKIEHV